jgi:hypothetical protein
MFIISVFGCVVQCKTMLFMENINGRWELRVISDIGGYSVTCLESHGVLSV